MRVEVFTKDNISKKQKFAERDVLWDVLLLSNAVFVGLLKSTFCVAKYSHKLVAWFWVCHVIVIRARGWLLSSQLIIFNKW